MTQKMLRSADLKNMTKAVSCSSEKFSQKLYFIIWGHFWTIYGLLQLRLSVLVNGKATGHPSQKFFLSAEHSKGIW